MGSENQKPPISVWVSVLPQNRLMLIPKIVVIRDRSSEKTSLIESPTGLTLPIVVKLEDDPYGKMKIELDYEGKLEAIQNESLTTETKDIGTKVLTLSAKKKGFMGLLILNLPRFIWHPTGDQPHDSYTRIKEISSHKRIIILCVVLAQADFEANESTCMARVVDTTGKKTLSVSTKCDRSNENLYVKVLATSRSHDHGSACAFEETRLFENNNALTNTFSQILWCNVGVRSLAEKIGEILSDIVLENYQDLESEDRGELEGVSFRAKTTATEACY
ncbi:hypothetical protein LXL04_016571 [Taraxacum kok-saghyz]